MKILGMGIPELVIILGVVLLIFGPKQLPKLGSALGKTMKGLREGLGDGSKEAEEVSDEDEVLELDEVEVEDEKPAPKKKTTKKAAPKKKSEEEAA